MKTSSKNIISKYEMIKISDDLSSKEILIKYRSLEKLNGEISLIHMNLRLNNMFINMFIGYRRY